MGEATVREILERIDNLPETDRLLLEQRALEGFADRSDHVEKDVVDHEAATIALD